MARVQTSDTWPSRASGLLQGSRQPLRRENVNQMLKIAAGSAEQLFYSRNFEKGIAQTQIPWSP